MTCDECGEEIREGHEVECCGENCQKWMHTKCAYRNGDAPDALTYCADCYVDMRYLARYGSKEAADAAMQADFRMHMAAMKGYQLAKYVGIFTLAMWLG